MASSYTWYRHGWTRRLCLSMAVVLLAACAQKSPLVAMAPRSSNPLSGTATEPGSDLADQRWSGRLVLKLAAFGKESAQGVNVSFDLQGNPTQGQLDMSTPMGTLVAQVRWQQAMASLSTADGTESFDSLHVLTQRVLGESLPVATMMSWLQGHPAPSPTWTARSDGQASPRQFTQAGWQVDLRELDQGTLLAERPGTLDQRGATLRLRLDR